MFKTNWEQVKTPLEKMVEAHVTEEELADAIEAIPSVKAKRRLVIENEQRKAQAYREGTLTFQQQLAAKKAAEKAEEAAEESRIKAYLDSKHEEDEARFKAEVARLAEKKIKDAEREKNRKIELKEWKKQTKARKELQKQEGVEAAKRAEASRVSKIKTIIGRVNLILSAADALYADLKPFRNPKLANDAEKEQIRKALDDASQRCRIAKRLMDK